jgi:hypothetical protein
MSLKTVIGGRDQRKRVEPRFRNNGRRQIIDEDSTATVVTATIQPKELADLEEGERLFHS